MTRIVWSVCPDIERVSGQRAAGSHPGQGGQLGLSPGLDGCAQWRREAEDGCKDSLTLLSPSG